MAGGGGIAYFCDDKCRAAGSSVVARVVRTSQGRVARGEPTALSDRVGEGDTAKSPLPVQSTGGAADVPEPVAGELLPAPDPLPQPPPAAPAATHERPETALTSAASKVPSASPARRSFQWGPGEPWFVASAALCVAAYVLASTGLLSVASGTLAAAALLSLVWVAKQRTEPLRRVPLAALTPLFASALALLLWFWQPPYLVVPVCAASVLAFVVLMRWLESSSRRADALSLVSQPSARGWREQPPESLRGAAAWVGSAVAAAVTAALGGGVEAVGVAGLVTLVAFGNPVLGWGSDFSPRRAAASENGARASSGVFWLLNLLVPLAVLTCAALGLAPPLAVPAVALVASGFWLAAKPWISGYGGRAEDVAQPVLDHPSAVGGREDS